MSAHYRLLSRNVAPITYAPLVLLKFLSAPLLHVCLLLCHRLVFFGILYPGASVISAKSTASFSRQLDCFLSTDLFSFGIPP